MDASWRSAVDRDAGIAFLHPPDCRAVAGEDLRVARVGWAMQGQQVKTQTGLSIRASVQHGAADQLDAILVAALPGAGPATAADYYATTRPAGARDWAPAGITGRSAATATAAALAFHHQDRIAVLVVEGEADAVRRQVMLDGFELLAGAPTPSTWREEQGRRKKVIATDGRTLDAATAPQRDDWAQAYLAESAHYELRAICPPRLIPGLLTDLERLHAALVELLPPSRTLKGKYRIKLARSADQFAALLGQLPGGSGTGRSFQGYFNPMDGTVYTFTDRVANTPGTPQLRLYHEGTHQYVLAMSGLALPPWLHEGFAVLMENLDDAAGKTRYGAPRERLLVLTQIYKQYDRPVRDFATYLAGTPLGNVHQYAESYAMLHHQIFARADGRKILHAWWQEACTGQPAGAAFERHFLAGGPYAGKDGLLAWQKAVRAHVLGGGAARFP